MPRIDVVKESVIARTPRVVQLEGLFDLPIAKRSTERWHVKMPIEDRAWSIGLIVGPSGAGKSSIAREIFGDRVVTGFKWPARQSLVDGFPPRLSIKDITGLLSSVGFSSPPAWLRPFAVLSTGEQFRVTLARALASSADVVVMDEFTSVVDRTVAQIGAAAVAKAVRRAKRQFVAVTCHYDIEPWLQPDWVYQPHLRRFQWRALQPRPPVELELRRVSHDAWTIFAPHHYLSGVLHQAARCFVATSGEHAVAFVAVMPQLGRRGLWREHRAVCRPDFQGVGIGSRVSEAVAAIVLAATGGSYASTTSHPGFIAARSRSPQWRMTSAPQVPGKHSVGYIAANWRFCATFRYVGPPCPEVELARALWAETFPGSSARTPAGILRSLGLRPVPRRPASASTS